MKITIDIWFRISYISYIKWKKGINLVKVIMKASDVGSTLTHKPNHRAKAVYKTLDKGQYAIEAKNIVMENAKTGEEWEIGNATPVFAKELIEYEMLMPKHRLEKTLPGVVGKFFADRKTWADKDEWNVKFNRV